jgi:hypothetical protein
VSIHYEDFEEVLHALVHESIEKNDRFWNQYGNYKRWDWDADAVTISFSDPEKPTLRIDVTVVGTTKGNCWQWTWANRNFESRSKVGMEKVREFGEVHGYRPLTTAFIDADDNTGWEMTSVAVHVLNAQGSYRFPTDEGHCYLIYRQVEVIPNDLDDLWGAMRGTVTIAPGVDLTEPTGEVWEAERDERNPSTNT